MRFIHRFKTWNVWRKHCRDHVVTKILVLFNIIQSSTFEIFERDCGEDLW
jgi:hypothetical protein